MDAKAKTLRLVAELELSLNDKTLAKTIRSGLGLHSANGG